jgi:hypothetical protein
MKNMFNKISVFLAGLAAAPAAVFAVDISQVPDAGSSALLLAIAGVGVVGVARFIRNRK